MMAKSQRRSVAVEKTAVVDVIVNVDISDFNDDDIREEVEIRGIDVVSLNWEFLEELHARLLRGQLQEAIILVERHMDTHDRVIGATAPLHGPLPGKPA